MMTLKTAVCVLVMFSASALAQAQSNSPANEPASSSERPILELDLRKYGYKPSAGGRRDYLSFAFADNDEVVFAWTTFDNPGVAQNSGPLTASVSHLHALLLNTLTGETKDRGDWPSTSHIATINPVGAQKFLICTGNTIQLLTHDFKTIKEQSLPRTRPCSGNRISPSRQTFSIDLGSGRDSLQTLMDAESFQPVGSWSLEDAIDVHFTDKLLFGNCRPDFKACIRGFDENWRPFRPAELDELAKGLKYRSGLFINDSTMSMLDVGGSELAVVTLTGDLVLRAALPKNYSYSRETISTGGKRFAFVETVTRGSLSLDWLWREDFRVAVYDLVQRQVIYTRKVRSGSPWVPPFEDVKNIIALSPDGTLLAIEVDGHLEVFRIQP